MKHTSPKILDNPHFVSAIFYSFLLIQAILVSLYHWHFHEPWHDEAQHLFLSLKTEGFFSLVEALRFEGHPPLLHLLFRFFSLFLDARTTLAVAGGFGYFVCSTSVFFLLTSARAPLRPSFFFALALSWSYAMAYEYGVIVRGYGLGMGLAFYGLGLSLHYEATQNEKSHFLGLFCLGLAILTSAHSALLTVVFAFPFLFYQTRQGRIAIVLRSAAVLTPCFLFLSYFVFGPSFRMTPPVPATAKAIGMKLYYASLMWNEGSYFRLVFRQLDQMFRAYSFPTVWWPFVYGEEIQWLGSCLLWSLLALTLVRLVLEFKTSLKAFIWSLAALAGVVVFIFFFEFLYPAAFRHSLFLAQPLFLALCCYWLKHPHKNLRESLHSSLPRQRLQSWTTLSGYFLIVMVCGFQIAANAYALLSDYQGQFSQTALAAHLIPDTDDVLIAADSDFSATSIGLWRPKAKLYSRMGGGRAFSYVRWDKARSTFKIPRAELLAKLCKKVIQSPKLSLYFVSLYPTLESKVGLHELPVSTPAAPTAVAEEKLRFFEVDCKRPKHFLANQTSQ